MAADGQAPVTLEREASALARAVDASSADSRASELSFLQRRFRGIVEGLLEPTGVVIDGDAPHDPQVHDQRFFGRLLLMGSLGLGESYMDGWWDCDDLAEMIHRILHHGRDRATSLADLWHGLQAVLLNLQSRIRSKVLVRVHYDLDADLFMSFLDRYNQYTCGYFEGTDDLEEAQEHKLDLICRKLRLREGLRVLDIGCGWGGFARFASERHGVEVTGLTISKEQARYAREFCEGLPVKIREQDYRDLEVDEPFDRILVCGMLEHVGYKNYRKLFETAARSLADDGLFLIQTIGSKVSTVIGEPWTTKYIFPNSMLPSLKQITGAIEGLFVLEDVHNFGAHYEKTVLAWWERFRESWPELKERYDERFYRMWRYYLLSSAGAFRARHNQLWHLVLSPQGVPGGYEAPR